ncbi:hypothetical protein M0805_000814 [Coniferiporia weirii]|nr:hypothetical protein M0805_000814 [Coniferiporia weirii]
MEVDNEAYKVLLVGSGADFKSNIRNCEGYTNFPASYGKDNCVWNVMRSGADVIFFRHVGKNGENIFNGIKVAAIKDSEDPTTARPHQVFEERRLQPRSEECGLVVILGWSGAVRAGTPRENAPFFEVLTDTQSESGRAWTISLREATSVGLVMNQDIANKKKQAQAHTPPAREFFLENLKLAPNLYELISTGELVGSPDGGPIVKSANNCSYSASSYAAPSLRIVGMRERS